MSESFAQILLSLLTAPHVLDDLQLLFTEKVSWEFIFFRRPLAKGADNLRKLADGEDLGIFEK